MSRQPLNGELLVPQPLLLPFLGLFQAAQTRNAPLNNSSSSSSSSAGAGDRRHRRRQRGEADRRHEALGLEPVPPAVARRVVIHAIHIAHVIPRQRAPERDPGLQPRLLVVPAQRLHFRGRPPRRPVRHELDADSALRSELRPSRRFGPVGARDAQNGREVEQGLGVEVVEESGGVLGDGHEVVGSDEAVPAAAAAFEEIEEGAETATAQEAGLGSEGVLEVGGREVSCGARAEQGA